MIRKKPVTQKIGVIASFYENGKWTINDYKTSRTTFLRSPITRKLFLD